LVNNIDKRLLVVYAGGPEARWVESALA